MGTWVVAVVGCMECGMHGKDLLEIIATVPTREAAVAEVAKSQGRGGRYTPENSYGEVLRFSDHSYFVLPIAAEKRD